MCIRSSDPTIHAVLPRLCPALHCALLSRTGHWGASPPHACIAFLQSFVIIEKPISGTVSRIGKIILYVLLIAESQSRFPYVLIGHGMVLKHVLGRSSRDLHGFLLICDPCKFAFEFCVTFATSRALPAPFLHLMQTSSHEQRAAARSGQSHQNAKRILNASGYSSGEVVVVQQW